MELNSIATAISNRLYQTFGDGYSFYEDEVEGEINMPAFSIVPLSLEQSKRIGRRKLLIMRLIIKYYSNSGRNDVMNKSLKLSQFNEIEYDSTTKLPISFEKCEIVDGIGHHYFNIEFYMQENDEIDLMECVEHQSKLRG